MAVCCVFGHREIPETDELRQAVYQRIEELILWEQVDTFLFGSKSQFDRLCYKTVTQLRKKYPLKRVYVRGEFPVIGEEYEGYLLERYEEAWFPADASRAGRAVYVARNHAMIDKSQFCLCYYREGYAPDGRKSGTAVAYRYACKQRKTVLNLGDTKGGWSDGVGKGT